MSTAADAIGGAPETRRGRPIGWAEERYRALVEQVPAIVYVGEFGPEGDWLYVSPQIERILGYTPQEWLAHPHPIASFVHPDDLDTLRAAEAEAFDHDVPLRCEYRIRARDGRWVWILDEGTAVRDAGGTPRFLQGLMHDTTERRQAEDALREALDKEQELSERLRSLDALKGTLLHTLSHDLRTPLTAVMTAAMTLDRMHAELGADERHEVISGMIARVRGMDRLLSDLLDLDRLDRGIVEPDRSAVDLAELVERVVAVQDAPPERAVRIDARPTVASVDPAQVERIVENLVANALRHAPAGTEVTVGVRALDGGALIAVEDRGPGVPDHLKEAVFEAFRQGPGAKRGQGTGIGLSLVRRFAELHGGRAWIEDRAGGGASFRVLLPEPPA
jgi:hypothetical protein